MPHAALFDVDGTLADTNHLHVTCWWEAFRQAGHRVAMRDIHQAIGLGSGDLITHLLGADVDGEEVERIGAAHKTLYATYFDRLAAFEGAGDLLRALAGRGRRIVLATSASGGELDALRAAVDADDVIAGTASSDDVSEGKPAPEPVENALDIAGCSAAEAVFVGDSVWDMRAATRAGVPAVAVLSGGICRSDLEEAGAVAVYQDVADLLARLDSSPFARTE
ncbi:haloacid dehalogenase superfamily, subfamily IA, variant 1 with third motif having Dx(3-4)D or Dx(3-4)E [Streptomyces sp. BpilaLS-43]|uniref:HAD family hydrolase n=1 Tax=Streptomyces sp. BpilaLS-43 TaxID=1839778 RepID=UPI00081AFD09|nr:HAD family hydrolase [Streptomyces sp. BpilaLS-43]SCD58444.1 haloacid dehalogenase superfamily, subfamily IA, variant 1 with third motif having Dx(3-4)D or Dx(3-4)E [Streptomyces sp. BpilaLS-43]